MKKTTWLLCGLFLFCCTINQAFSQKFIDGYYNYRWQGTPSREDASFQSHAINTDSGWYRIDYFLSSPKSSYQMIGLYQDKENKVGNGTFRWYYPNGRLKQFGKYVLGKKEGTWLSWYANGAPRDSANYIHGLRSGISMSWYKDGNSMDSVNMNEDGFGTFVSWFDNGFPASAGRYQHFLKSGKWVYYHRNGKPSALEVYDADSLKTAMYFDENGAKQDSALQDASPMFKGGRKAWNNYLGNNLHFPPNLDIVNSDHVVVVVDATIDEDGHVVDAIISVPFHPAFEKEALRCLSTAPAWIPAISHNRKVQGTYSLAVEFGQGYQ